MKSMELLQGMSQRTLSHSLLSDPTCIDDDACASVGQPERVMFHYTWYRTGHSLVAASTVD